MKGRAIREPKDRATALRLISSARFDPNRLVMLDSPPDELMARRGVKPPIPSGEIEIVVYEAERVELRVASDAPAIAVLTDAQFPGWEATLDGQSVPLLRANTNFRAVVVPAGNHEIEMRYRPASFRWGATLSGIALLGCGVALAVRPRLREPEAGGH